jgi:hypothetical protein
MELNYRGKEIIMQQLFEKYLAPAGFRSTYKGVPIDSYEQIKQFIDFTKYYVMFRGPRPHRSACSTRKRDAHSFDVYQHSQRDTERNRIEREAFIRGVKWANNRSH